MRLPSSGDFAKITEPDEFQRQICIVMSDVVACLNGNVEFDLNMRSLTVQVNFTAANSLVIVPHTLRKVPTGYIQAGSNAATSIYNLLPSDTRNIYLQSSAIAIVQVVIF